MTDTDAVRCISYFSGAGNLSIPLIINPVTGYEPPCRKHTWCLNYRQCTEIGSDGTRATARTLLQQGYIATLEPIDGVREGLLGIATMRARTPEVQLRAISSRNDRASRWIREKGPSRYFLTPNAKEI